MKKEDLSRTESAWWNSLSHWPIQIRHIKGEDNTMADYLSRDLYIDPVGLVTPNPSLFGDAQS